MARFNKLFVKKLYMPDGKDKGQLDKLVRVTATASEMNILDGVTASTSELNNLVGTSPGRTRVEVTGNSTLTDEQVQNTIVTNYGMSTSGDTTLPAYEGSTSFTIICEAASKSWSIKPPTDELFVLDGTALDANDEVDVGRVVGDMAQLIRIRTGASSYQWHYLSSIGTHSDGGQS